MGYTIELEDDDLRCKTEGDARKAAALIEADEWIHPYHLVVAPRCTSSPPRDDAWMLSVEGFQGDHWRETPARTVWLAIAQHMADDASIEFRGEEGDHWRIRWSGGRVYEEYPKEVIWALEREVTHESLKE